MKAERMIALALLVTAALAAACGDKSKGGDADVTTDPVAEGDGAADADAAAEPDAQADDGAAAGEDAAPEAEAVEDAVADADATADPDAEADASTDAPSDTTADAEADGPSGPTLAIVIVGDPASAVTWSDAYAAQTPSNFTIGIQRVDLMTSAGDTSPVTIFDAGAGSYTVVDMAGTTPLTTISLASVASGVYTHARVQLAMTRFQVLTTVHSYIALTGNVSVVAALSDTVIDATSRSKDWMQYTFSFSGLDITRADTLPAFPNSATGTVVEEADKTWLVMSLSDHMTINPSITTSYTATVLMKTQNCFRWQDASTGGYTTGVFDSAADGSHETVMSFGPGDYSITVE